jgi:holliday junction DNA helicase RuvA
VIGHLRGRILRKEPQEVLLDVSGVGYRVAVPVSTFYRLPDIGVEAALVIHTHVREDSLALFGFLTTGEHALFERLISVTGVGPKLALNILSGIEAADLVHALRQGDVPRLTRIPGVGKKTADRLVLELKDKVRGLVAGPEAPAGPEAAPPHEDLILALVHLGYSRAEAERGVERALRDGASDRFEDLLRGTLRILSGR